MNWIQNPCSAGIFVVWRVMREVAFRRLKCNGARGGRSGFLALESMRYRIRTSNRKFQPGGTRIHLMPAGRKTSPTRCVSLMSLAISMVLLFPIGCGGGGGTGKASAVHSRAPVTWARAIGGNGYETAYSIRQTADGGYIVAGSTDSFGAGNVDVWLVKLDSQGNQVWAKTYGGRSNDWARSARQTSDGGYIVAGYTISYREIDTDEGNAWIIRLDSSGNQIWTKVLGGLKWDEADSIQQTPDGGFVIGGFTYS